MSGYQNEVGFGEQSDLDFTCLLDDPATSLGLSENEPITSRSNQNQVQRQNQQDRFDDQRQYNGNMIPIT